ncbi:hypothetical protein FDZ74_17725, partial [bacterium]
MVISIVLFLSVSFLSSLAQKSAQSITEEVPYDVTVFVTSSATADEKHDFYTAVSRLDDVNRSVIVQDVPADVVLEKDRIPANIQAILDSTGISPEDGGYRTYFTIESIDDAALARYALENGIDVALLKDTANPGGILINTVTTQENGRFQFSKLLNVKAGETLKLTLASVGDELPPSTTLTIAALADKMPLGNTAIFEPMRATLVVSEDVFTSLLANQPQEVFVSGVNQFIQSSNPSRLVESIQEYQKGTSIGYVSIYDVAAAQKDSRQV